MESIRLTDVRVNAAARRYVSHVLDSGKLAQGGFVRALESGMAQLSGVSHAVAVSNGTAALYLALIAAGVQQGDKVILPAFTFAGTANAAHMAGADIVFADIGDDWLIDTDQALDLARKHDARFVMPVHLYGQRVDIQPFVEAEMTVVEDAAQAIGHRVRYGAFSFYGSKTVGCGEGGMVVGDEKERFAWMFTARNQGMVSRYAHVMPGFNFRMTDLQAAVAVGQYLDLPAILSLRTAHADYLWQELHDLPVKLPNPFGHTWHLFTMEVDNRDDFRIAMDAAGIETGVYYPQALPDIGWLPDADVPNARRAAQRVVSLPIHEHLTSADMERVAATAREAIKAFVA